MTPGVEVLTLIPPTIRGPAFSHPTIIELHHEKKGVRIICPAYGITQVLPSREAAIVACFGNWMGGAEEK